MPMQAEPHYKAIIIGAGITGLSTGIAWTKLFPAQEHPVLIIEKQPVVGGCVTTFARSGYRFDTVQIIPDVSEIFRFLGIEVELCKFDPCYARLFLADPSKKEARIFPVASDRNAFEDFLIRIFPDDAPAIRRFFDSCTAMHSELRYLKTEPRVWQLPGILYHCRRIIANSNKTYKRFLTGFGFKNREVFEILNMFSSFSGLSANRCAALLTACALITTLRGSYRPARGFIQFPILLKKVFEERGGKIMLNTTVNRILSREGQVTGVELADGTRLQADIVVSTADTKVTFGQMLGYDKLESLSPVYARKVQQVRMSPSAFTIHLGLDNDLDLKHLGYNCGYNVLTTGHQAHEALFDAWEREQLLMDDDCFHLAVISPSALIGGKPTLIIRVVPVAAKKWIDLRESDYESYVVEKQNVADFYIQKVEEYMIPDLRKHIVYTDIATPATYARYIGSPTGSNYDMMPVPENFGKNRLKTRTPLKNLFVPKFSHGIWPSLQAGLQVVDMVSGGKIMNGNSSYGQNGDQLRGNQ